MPCDYCTRQDGTRQAYLKAKERCPYCEMGKAERLGMALSLAAQAMGARGGAAGTGKAKVRGNSAYYRRLVAKRKDRSK